MPKKIFFPLVILLVLILGTFTWLRNAQQKIFIPHNQSQADTNSITNDFTNQTPFNILLLGYGGGNHDGAYLTDSMMVLHVDPKTKKMLLISIPRDIWIKIPTDGENGQYWKINSAYEIGMDDQNYPNKQTQFTGQDGAGHLAEYITEQVTGLPINNFVGLDFAGFTKTIDTLGGVTINVENSFDDYQYPRSDELADATCGLDQTKIASLSAEIATGSASVNVAFPCRYLHVHLNAGSQHMDGKTALEYVRSRHGTNGEGSDFARSKRQRNLILAVKKQIMSVGFVPKAIPFITSLENDLKTDLTLDDVKTFTQQTTSLNNYTIQSIAITDQNYLKDAVSSDGQDILEPTAGLSNWGQVHNYIESYINPNYVISQPVIQVSNASGITGLAALATTRLSDRGFDVLEPITAKTGSNQTTGIALYGRKISNSALNQLKKEFPSASIQTINQTNDSYDILVTLGKDYNLKLRKKVLN